MTTIEQFVDRLLEEKGITADPAIMDEYRADLLARVGERLNAEMIALMSADQVQELNDLLDTNPEPDVLKELFMTHVANYEEVFATTLADFRTSYLS